MVSLILGAAIGCMSFASQDGSEGLPTIAKPASASPATLKNPGLHAVPRLITEQPALVAGQTNFVGVTFEIEPHWHMYWKGQNDAGMAPEFTLELPEGYSGGEILWPAPKRDIAPGDILNYVYYDRLTVLIPISVPLAAAGKSETIKASMEWLVCEEGCVLEKSAVELRISVVGQPADSSKVVAPAETDASVAPKLFHEARAKLPRLVGPKDPSVQFEAMGSTLTLTVPGATHLEFFPDIGGVIILNAIKGGSADQSALKLEYEELDGSKPLWGILQVTRPGAKGPEWLEVRFPLPAAGTKK